MVRDMNDVHGIVSGLKQTASDPA